MGVIQRKYIIKYLIYKKEFSNLTGDPLMASRHIKAIILILLASCLVAPGFAGTKYLNGAPNLTASITGPNQYSAGSDIQIPVIIKNTGMSTNFEVADNIIDTDVPATAKFVTVSMGAGNAPLVIKSDPQMIGDIPSQSEVTATFSAKVNSDASGGSYTLPLTINYTRFSYADQYGLDTNQYYYVTNNVTVTVPVTIKAEVIPEVVSATSEQITAGAEGYVNLTITNLGSLDGTKATVQIVEDDASPITPVDSSVYIGDFPAGGNVSCQYKIAVSRDAENKTYPVDVIVDYQDSNGNMVQSQTQTVGINVGNRVDFAILSDPVEMSPGSKKTIEVEYRNIGDAPVTSAEARISVVAPFTSSSDVAYLGDIAPGQTAVAQFQIGVSSDATLKEYGLNSEIRYNDALDDTYVSDPMKVSINVKNLSGIQGIVSNPIYVSLLVAIIIGAIYGVIHKKRHQ